MKNKKMLSTFVFILAVAILCIATAAAIQTMADRGLSLSKGECNFSPDSENLGETVDGKVPESTSLSAESLPFSVQYVRTDGYHDGAVFPKTVVIQSKKELDTYYEEEKDVYWLGRKSDLYEGATEDGFLDVCDEYDTDFFTKKALVMVLLEEGSGSIRHRVDSAELYPDGVLAVSISALVPEVGTDDMAQWHVIIELDRDKVPKDEEDVTVCYKNPLTENTPSQKDDLDGFSFYLRWGTYGISSYDSKTGTLVKTSDATYPEKYVTRYRLTPAQKQGIYDMIQYLDIESYPDEYNPHGNAVSTPYMTVVLSVKEGGFEKTITVPETALSYDADNKKGQIFLDVCRYIEDILTETEEWKALPDYEFLYD